VSVRKRRRVMKINMRARRRNSDTKGEEERKKIGSKIPSTSKLLKLDPGERGEEKEREEEEEGE
jgi:hypothetical protein